MRARYDDSPPDPPEDPSVGVLEEISAELERQHALAHAGNTAAYDLTNSDNDFIAVTLAYLGRASRKVFRNDRENQGFRENMIKAAAVIVSAIATYDIRNYTTEEPDYSE